jgi:hypothetical protein
VPSTLLFSIACENRKSEKAWFMQAGAGVLLLNDLTTARVAASKRPYEFVGTNEKD